MRGPRVANWKSPTDVKSAGGWLCHVATRYTGMYPGVGKNVRDSNGNVYRQTLQGNLVRVGKVAK